MKYFILTLAFCSFAAIAQEKTYPCMEDAQKFCPDHKGDKMEMAKCIKAHEKELSPACKERMAKGKEQMQAKVKDIIANCKEDVQKLCKDAPKGHGGKLKCLKEKKAETSANCQAVL